MTTEERKSLILEMRAEVTHQLKLLGVDDNLFAKARKQALLNNEYAYRIATPLFDCMCNGTEAEAWEDCRETGFKIVSVIQEIIQEELSNRGL